MMQAAKSWHRYDSAAGFGILLSPTSGRCSLRLREMRPVFVIIADVLPHQAFQMPLIQNNYMVKHIASAVADPALGHAVLPRTAEAGSLRLNAEALDSVDHFLIEIGSAIKDQIAERGIVGKCLAQLLGNSRAGRTPGDIAVKDSSPIMCDNEKAV